MNKLLDDKLENTSFIRIENYTTKENNIKIKCGKCNEFELNSRFSRLLKRIPPCKLCYGYEQIKILNKILKPYKFKVYGPYKSGKEKMEFKCLKCNTIKKYRSDQIKTRGTIGKCESCN